jgi:hypothetical protein
MDLKLSDLGQFTGTEQWYKFGLTNITCTDGAKHVADHAGAYWLLDEIALAQVYDVKVNAEAFQVWKLAVKDSSATLTCEDGNGNVVMTKKIEFTDFPLPTVELWYTDKVILLPSEY